MFWVTQSGHNNIYICIGLLSPPVFIQRHRTQEEKQETYGHFSNFPQMTSISPCRPVYLQPRPGPNIGSHRNLSRNVNILHSPMSRSVSLLVTVATLGAMVRSSMAVTCYSCGPQVTSWSPDHLVLAKLRLSGGWPGPGDGQWHLLCGSSCRVLQRHCLVCQDLARQHQWQHDGWEVTSADDWHLDCVWRRGESPPDWLSLLLWDKSI